MKLDPPPPSAALAEAVSRMQPVSTRSPWRTSLMMAAILAAYIGLLLLFVLPMRPDLRELPRLWLFGVGVAWLLGMLLPLGAVLLPRRGQVLPDGGRALWAAVTAVVALLVVSLLFPPPGPTSPVLFGHCLQIGMALAVVPVGAVLLVSSKLAPAGSWRLGAAIGAGGGALSGMLLHLYCPVVSRWHVTAAHVGVAILCAVLGAMITPRVAK